MTSKPQTLSELDKLLINNLQKGLPISERPFADIAKQFNQLPSESSKAPTQFSEDDIIERLNHLLDTGILTRFGPMFDAACLGGAFTLAAIAVPEARFDDVATIVNSFEQVAHNYARAHELNMWFVVGAESQQEVEQVIADIETQTSLAVLNVPKLEEFYVGLYFPV